MAILPGHRYVTDSCVCVWLACCQQCEAASYSNFKTCLKVNFGKSHNVFIHGDLGSVRCQGVLSLFSRSNWRSWVVNNLRKQHSRVARKTGQALPAVTSDIILNSSWPSLLGSRLSVAVRGVAGKMLYISFLHCKAGLSPTLVRSSAFVCFCECLVDFLWFVCSLPTYMSKVCHCNLVINLQK